MNLAHRVHIIATPVLFAAVSISLLALLFLRRRPAILLKVMKIVTPFAATAGAALFASGLRLMIPGWTRAAWVYVSIAGVIWIGVLFGTAIMPRLVRTRGIVDRIVAGAVVSIASMSVALLILMDQKPSAARSLLFLAVGVAPLAIVALRRA